MATQITTRRHRRPKKGDMGNLLFTWLLVVVVVVLAGGLFWILTSPQFLVPGR